MKYVQTLFLKENLCALQVFLCATCELRGNIGRH